MELMELVENEPTARPFQCDWQSCNKVSSQNSGSLDPASFFRLAPSVDGF